MNKQYILALDQGTTSSRAIIFDKAGNIISSKSQEFKQIFPKPGYVEHDPNEIWMSQLSVAKIAMAQKNITAEEIVAIGVTNQRETTIIWDRETGIPIYNAIVWQDRRTSHMIDELKNQGYADTFKDKTGLILDAYFSGTKVRWILDNVPNARQMANKGRLAFGTVDSWLIYNLTNKRNHVTDESNAARTLLFNIHKGCWDRDLLNILDIPESILPQIVPSSGVIGEASSGLFGIRIPITGICGDQQSATFGNLCLKPGMVKNTYGTGCFLLMNTGNEPLKSQNNLLTTIGWNTNNQRQYCLEGSVFVGGAVTQWIRDGLNLIKDSREIEQLATSVPDNGGIYMVPAFTGLGAPHWDQYARGAIFGITRGTTGAHIARAAVESIAFQVYDLIKAMEDNAQTNLSVLRVDGGACRDNFLMQFQADILNARVERPKCLELTALGAAYLAGLAIGFWSSIHELETIWQLDRIFEPQINDNTRSNLLKSWHEAVTRSKNWVK